MYRLTANQAIYNDYLAKTKGHACPFCTADPQRKTIHQTAHALVIQNIFPFDFWEGYKVADHLLLTPKRHVGDLAELTKEERADIMDTMCLFEPKGYNVYTRAPQSGARAYPHVHIHLIKLQGEAASGMLFVRTPHTLVMW